jgi:hypothetical protein
MPRITLNKIKEIIREELLREGEEHQAAVDMADASAKLLKALEAFEEHASEKLKSDVRAHVDDLKQTLGRVVSSPMTYVDAPKKVVTPAKKVSFKPDTGGLVK